MRIIAKARTFFNLVSRVCSRPSAVVLLLPCPPDSLLEIIVIWMSQGTSYRAIGSHVSIAYRRKAAPWMLSRRKYHAADDFLLVYPFPCNYRPGTVRILFAKRDDNFDPSCGPRMCNCLLRQRLLTRWDKCTNVRDCIWLARSLFEKLCGSWRFTMNSMD